MEKYFEDLTHRNWGAPWHFGLAQLLFSIVAFILSIWLKDIFVICFFAFLITNFVGYLNEVFERHFKVRLKNGRQDMFEDMLANLCGSMLQAILFYGIFGFLKVGV